MMDDMFILLLLIKYRIAVFGGIAYLREDKIDNDLSK